MKVLGDARQGLSCRISAVALPARSDPAALFTSFVDCYDPRKPNPRETGFCGQYNASAYLVQSVGGQGFTNAIESLVAASVSAAQTATLCGDDQTHADIADTAL